MYQKKASELNFTLPHIMGSFHKGKLPEVRSYFECDNENIIVTAIKQSEDDNKTIIRAYEANGEFTNAKIKLFDKEITTEFSHNEVKTFKEKEEVNMIELL